MVAFQFQKVGHGFVYFFGLCPLGRVWASDVSGELLIGNDGYNYFCIIHGNFPTFQNVREAYDEIRQDWASSGRCEITYIIVSLSCPDFGKRHFWEMTFLP